MVEASDEDASPTLRGQPGLVEYALSTAAGSIGMGTINANEYLREGLFALREAVEGLPDIVAQLVDRHDASRAKVAQIAHVRDPPGRPGDGHKRRRVDARVVGAGAMGGLSVEPLGQRVSWRQASAREGLDHWRHARPDHAERPPEGQRALGGGRGDVSHADAAGIPGLGRLTTAGVLRGLVHRSDITPDARGQRRSAG